MLFVRTRRRDLGEGYFVLVDRTYSPVNKNCFPETRLQEREAQLNDKKRPFRVHLMWGHYFIVLDYAVHPRENEQFTMERLPSGKIVFDPKVY